MLVLHNHVCFVGVCVSPLSCPLPHLPTSQAAVSLPSLGFSVSQIVANSLLTPAVTRLEVLDGQGMGQTIWAVHGLEESQIKIIKA